MPGSAQPLMPNITGRRPLCNTASATASGSLPPPQMIASGVRLTSGASGPPPWRSGGIMLGFFAAVLHPRMHQRPLSSFADEGNYFADSRVLGELTSDVLHPVGKRTFAEKQLAVGAAQFLQLRARNAAAAQTDHVQSHQIVDIGHGERDDIGAKRAHSCNHSAFSDAAELMHRGKPAEKYVVADRYVTAQRYIIGKRN